MKDEEKTEILKAQVDWLEKQTKNYSEKIEDYKEKLKICEDSEHRIKTFETLQKANVYLSKEVRFLKKKRKELSDTNEKLEEKINSLHRIMRDCGWGSLIPKKRWWWW